MKRMMLFGLISLLLCNNSVYSMAAQTSSPFSATRIALGLGTVTGVIASRLGYNYWYKNSFVLPVKTLEAEIDELHSDCKQLESFQRNTKILLKESQNEKKLSSRDIIAVMRGQLENTEFYNVDHKKKLGASLKSMEDHVVEHARTIDVKNKLGGASLKYAENHALEPAKVDNGCDGSEKDPKLCPELKTNALQFQEQLNAFKAATDNKHSKKTAKRDEIMTEERDHIRKVGLFKSDVLAPCMVLAVLGTAVYGASRLVSWYRNR